MTNKVPFFDYPRAYTDDKHDVSNIIDSVCSKGAFIMQDELSNFEKKLSFLY